MFVTVLMSTLFVTVLMGILNDDRYLRILNFLMFLSSLGEFVFMTIETKLSDGCDCASLTIQVGVVAIK